MEGFHYVNIFETKGIEYLIIIGFLIMLVLFWYFLNRNVKINTYIQNAIRTISTGILRIPQGLYFSDYHTWAYLERSGSASVGLDDLLLHLTGSVWCRHLKNPGEEVRKGEVFLEVGQQEKQLRIFSPISGTITEINPAVSEQPDLVRDDPYKKGWIVRIRPSDWKRETSTCYLAAEATVWSGRELNRFKDFLSLTLPKYAPETPMDVLQDGGELCDHTLSELPGELWQDFQAEFLNPKK